MNDVLDLIIQEVPVLQRQDSDYTRKILAQAINSLGYVTEDELIDLELRLLTLNQLDRSSLRGKIYRRYKELR